MNLELIFIVEDALEGGFLAKALGVGIFTQGDTLPELKRNIRDAVHCHFEEGEAPKIIRLHFTKEEVMAL